MLSQSFSNLTAISQFNRTFLLIFLILTIKYDFLNNVFFFQGDSGSPLMWITEKNTFFLGITFYGDPCSELTLPKNTKYMRKPGLYVRLENFTRWIEETIDRERRSSKFLS